MREEEEEEKRARRENDASRCGVAWSGSHHHHLAPTKALLLNMDGPPVLFDRKSRVRISAARILQWMPKFKAFRSRARNGSPGPSIP